jgi:hypothetical protein
LTALLAEKRVMILMPTNLSAEVEAALDDVCRCNSDRPLCPVTTLRTALEQAARIKAEVKAVLCEDGYNPLTDSTCRSKCAKRHVCAALNEEGT